MRIFRHPNELTADARGGVVALGNFDGVHLGHQMVICTALNIGRDLGVPAGVMTFEPHPRQLFQPDQPPFRLTPMRIKARHVEALGANFLYMQHFDAAFAAHSAEQFVDEILVQNMRVAHVVVGYDYVFGKGRRGNAEFLQSMAVDFGFGVTQVAPVMGEDGQVYSSTRVRAALREGRPADAARILGRDWEIEGRVEKGDQRGRTIGFPTANVALDEYMRPAYGVYAARAGIDKGEATVWYDAVANIGRRPTFDKLDDLLEVHLFNYDGDLYGQHLRVALVDYIRPERKFDGLGALKDQITQDCGAARLILAGVTKGPIGA